MSEIPKTPEQMRAEYAEQSRILAVELICRTSAAHWDTKPIESDTYLLHKQKVPWMIKTDGEVTDLQIYVTGNKFRRVEHPRDLLATEEEEDESAEWGISTRRPESGIRFHPRLGLKILKNDRYVGIEESTATDWERLTKHLTQIHALWEMQATPDI